MLFASCFCPRMGPTVTALGSCRPLLRGGLGNHFTSSSGETVERFSWRCSLRQHQALHCPSFTSSNEGNSRVTVCRCEKHSEDRKGSSGDEDKPIFLTMEFWLQVAIFLLAAGFVDAGFSGDWSRIGVLTKETEGELQMAAIGVVPLAATLIWSIAQRRKL